MMECLRLRIKGLDIAQRQITMRQGKGDKDRVTMLPALVMAALHLTTKELTGVLDDGTT